jgi:D-aminopeptidase
MAREYVVLTAVLLAGFVSTQATTSNTWPRASDLGLKIGILPTGRLNTITDVAGVEVGHTTIISGNK